MWKDYFRIAFDGIRHRGLRTWLTLVGIFIGISAVVALVSIGHGLQGAIESEFKDLGTDKIMVSPAGTFAGSGGAAVPLTTKDVDTVKKVSGVEDSGYMVMEVTQLEWGRDDVYFSTVLGVPVDSSYPMMEKALALKVGEGRTFRNGDVKKVIIGYDLARSADFSQNIKLGQKLMIEGAQFEVIGVKERIGNEQDDRQIVIPEEAFKEIYPDNDEISVIVVQVKQGVSPPDLVAPLEKALRRERNLKEGQEDFQIQTFEELIKSFLTIFNIVEAVIIGIAAISLLVGAVGITNTMYTAVLERTSDIGIMKAIGARNSDILGMFLIESGLLGFVGGAVGVIIGLGVAKLVEIVGGAALGTNLLKAAMPAWLIIGALVFAFILGSASGILPARQASRMNPVDALREE
jgi:putative ABC transport system permease protein